MSIVPRSAVMTKIEQEYQSATARPVVSHSTTVAGSPSHLQLLSCFLFLSSGTVLLSSWFCVLTILYMLFLSTFRISD
jgi:hypothetical protein